MKKILLVMMLLSIIQASFTQNRNTAATEALFNNPAPGTLKNRFDFLLPNGNKMQLEFTGGREQFVQLTNIDSVIKKAWRFLQLFKDSLEKPLVSRRIDYVFTQKDEKVRITEYPQKSGMYQIKNGDTVQLKVEQDTLRIRLYTLSYQPPATEQPYFITLLLNNITDVEALVSTDIAKGITLFKEDVQNNKLQLSKGTPSFFYALYDVAAGKAIQRSATSGTLRAPKSNMYVYNQIGLQYVRGSWAPSASAGVEFKRNISLHEAQHFYLYWEPYFFFNKTASSKLLTDRNDFITFRYAKITTGENRSIKWATNVAFGYLVRRKGDGFEKNTFKFTLPGIQTQRLLLEPEFFFNNFFKNFSPSPKLVIYLN